MMDELEEAKKLTDTDAGIMDNYEYLLCIKRSEYLNEKLKQINKLL